MAAKKYENPGEKVDMVDVALIDDCPLNPRKTFGDLAELKASIESKGLIHPVLLRPSPASPGRFEIVAGHRRVRACRELGVRSILAVVRLGLSDQDVVEIALIENSTREDVPPLEEAEAYAKLHAPKSEGGFGLSLEQIADRGGRSITHIQRRLRLGALAPIVKDAVAQGFLLANAAALLSRLDSHTDQAEVIGRIFKQTKAQPGEPGFKPATERDVVWLVESQLRQLVNAPFDINDAKLVPVAGACPKCPKRTAAQSTLFPIGADEMRGDDDRCTDGDCWRSKTHAHGLVQLGKTKAKVLSPEESREYLGEYGRLDTKKAVDLDAKVDPYDYDSRKKWKDVVKEKLEAVVVVDGDGQAHLVVPAKEAKKLLPPKKDEPKPTMPAAPARDPLEDEIDEARTHALSDAIAAHLKKHDDVATLRALALVFARHEYRALIETDLEKAKTMKQFVAAFGNLATTVAKEDCEERTLAEDLLGKKEVLAIAKKAEDEVRTKHASKSGAPNFVGAMDKAAKKGGKR